MDKETLEALESALDALETGEDESDLDHAIVILRRVIKDAK